VSEVFAYDCRLRNLVVAARWARSGAIHYHNTESMNIASAASLVQLALAPLRRSTQGARVSETLGEYMAAAPKRLTLQMQPGLLNWRVRLSRRTATLLS
jgi:hypothetical protein